MNPLLRMLFQFLGGLLGEFRQNPVGFVIGIMLIVALTPVALTQLGKLISQIQTY